MKNKKESFIAFLLGLIIGNKILPIIMHIIYLAVITILTLIIVIK